MQQSPNDKSGLGFKSNNKNKSKNNNKKKGQVQVKDPVKIVCFKCNIEGHHVRSCPLKKKQKGKRPQAQTHIQPQVEEMPLPKKKQANAPIVEKPSEKKEKKRTCYICREKGHISSLCTIGTSSNSITIDDVYSLRKDEGGNVFAKYVGAQSGETKRGIIHTFPTGIGRGTPDPGGARPEALRASLRGASRSPSHSRSTVLAVAARRWVSTPTHCTPGGTIFSDNHLTIHIEMAKNTPVEYEDRNGKVKALREADLIGSSYDARSHGVNTVDLSHSIREPGFAFDANMAGFVIRHDADKAKGSHARGKEKDEAVPRDRPQDDDKRYLAEEEVRSMRYPRSSSVHLLSKYDQPYDRRHRYGGGDQRDHRSDADGRYRRNNDGCERRARGRCTQQRGRTNRVTVFKRLGPLPPQSKRTESSQEEDFEESGREEDRYRQPRRCPDGPSQSRERRVQRPRSLEEAEARYLYILRISRPDLATKIQRMVETKARPPKKVWRLKQAEADAQASTDADADASVDTDVAQEWTTCEQRHPESYQDKCRRVTLIEKDEDEGPARDQEFTNVEWTRGTKPESSKGAKQPGPAKGFDFDLSKTEQIFDWLLKEKQLKLPDGHRSPRYKKLPANHTANGMTRSPMPPTTAKPCADRFRWQ
ncbi:hypothetical protein QYE76_027640 [Lolium multiflorum]|uniref:CCHC-type domain-containing protein n=1 Tax=Lolium multiflorum TaxID=4521 RepID=A0AAD8QKA1_LOLMU|nr:hypothetical protein QYE76_027640 [Lolium multiflorum]